MKIVASISFLYFKKGIRNNKDGFPLFANSTSILEISFSVYLVGSVGHSTFSLTRQRWPLGIWRFTAWNYGSNTLRVLYIGLSGPYFGLKNLDGIAQVRGKMEVLLLVEAISYHRGEGKREYETQRVSKRREKRKGGDRKWMERIEGKRWIKTADGIF